MPQPNFEWTTGAVSVLHEEVNKGTSARKIACLLSSRFPDSGSVTRNAVIGKMHREGLRSKRSAGVRDRKPRPPKVYTRPTPPAPQKVENFTPPLSSAAGAFDSVMALSDEHCRYPYGDPQGRDFRFCGAARAHGSSYCAHHTATTTLENSSARSNQQHHSRWRPRPKRDWRRA